MSRVGQKPVPVPAGVEAKLNGNMLSIKGPKGALALAVSEMLAVSLDGKSITLTPKSDAEGTNALHGLNRSLVANMIGGVTRGYAKELEIQGVGYKVVVQGRKAVFSLGFSHPVELTIPQGIEIKVTNNVNLVVSGPDKQQVGDLSARIKSFYPAEPYKGKGIRFKGEYVRRKVGKTVA